MIIALPQVDAVIPLPASKVVPRPRLRSCEPQYDFGKAEATLTSIAAECVSHALNLSVSA